MGLFGVLKQRWCSEQLCGCKGAIATSQKGGLRSWERLKHFRPFEDYVMNSPQLLGG